MHLFNEVKGYKTRENAVRKLCQVVMLATDDLYGECDLGSFCHWHIGVNDKGRFYPVVSHVLISDQNESRGIHLQMAHAGICITAN
jgi:hypothetical protein